MNSYIRAAALAAAIFAAPAFAVAQNMPAGHDHGTMDHGAMGHGNTASAAASGSTAAYEAANARMHEGMAISFSGNADVDFARGMIPHHQGAIDMAKIQLEHGKDPELRKLAEEVIKAQEGEIAFLKAWLEKNAK